MQPDLSDHQFDSNVKTQAQITSSPLSEDHTDSAKVKESKFKLPNKLTAALLIFGVVGSVFVFLLPHITSSNSQSPPFSMMLITGLIIIALTGILLALVPSMGLNVKRRALVLVFAVNAVIIIVKFILIPLGLYNSNKQYPFTVGNALTTRSLAAPITTAIGAFFLYAFFLWIIKKYYSNKYSNLGVTKVNRSLISKIFHSIFLIIASFIIVASVWIFAGIYFGVSSYLGEAGNLSVIGLLLLMGFIMTIFIFKISYEQAKETGSILAITSIFWLMLSIILLYHVMWVIFSGALITIWPFKTVLPTPTK